MSNTLHIIYLILSSLTLVECVVTIRINMLDNILKTKYSTVFANSLSGSIGLLSAISLLCNVYFLSYTVPKTALWPCILLTICLRYLHTVSCFHLACLALDRYLAICWPLHYNTWVTKFRCRGLSVACWTAPTALILLPCAADLLTMCQEKTYTKFLIAYIVAYSLGAITTFFLYLLVAREFQKSKKIQTGIEMDKLQQLMKVKSARSAQAVLAFYIFLSLPHVSTLRSLSCNLLLNLHPKHRDNLTEDLLCSTITLLFFPYVDNLGSLFVHLLIMGSPCVLLILSFVFVSCPTCEP